ncbi:MAG: polyprenyl synthetase family protein [Ruminococcaceae bacterium]|nr:polyprenyl synthetase family protein [Oscillospiraceae bacterium]
MTVTGYAQMFEEALPSFVAVAEHEKADMREMLMYSLESGGKRVRPVLCLAFCELCGGKAENALPFAAAVEFIHTYSLVHDDLPCMDNDDYRRGKLSSHKKYGEANALLAGDALLTHAFSLIAQAVEQKSVSAQAAIKAVGVLSSCAGLNGMIGGQFVDLAMEGKKSTIDDLFLMDRYKTAALIRAACQLGCIAAGATAEMIEKSGQFAENLGLAFQIVDDLLDDEDETSSDKVNNKATYPALLGAQRARELAEEYTKNAVDALSVFGERAVFLRAFALQLVNRKV